MICLLLGLLAAEDPVTAPIVEVPGLPRVLLIGDSISMGYTLGVRARLDGVANVHRIPENGGPTSRGVERLDDWLGERRWKVIHANFGLHDLKIMDEMGSRQVPPREYRANLEAIHKRLASVADEVIWASTTPVPEGPVNPRREPSDVVRYNDLAAAVAASRGVVVNDLYTLVLPRLSELQQPVNVHFRPEGSEVLADAVAAAIVAALERAERPAVPGPVRQRRR